jgi:hypothetical protein
LCGQAGRLQERRQGSKGGWRRREARGLVVAGLGMALLRKVTALVPIRKGSPGASLSKSQFESDPLPPRQPCVVAAC